MAIKHTKIDHSHKTYKLTMAIKHIQIDHCRKTYKLQLGGTVSSTDTKNPCVRCIVGSRIKGGSLVKANSPRSSLWPLRILLISGILFDFEFLSSRSLCSSWWLCCSPVQHGPHFERELIKGFRNQWQILKKQTTTFRWEMILLLVGRLRFLLSEV